MAAVTPIKTAVCIIKNLVTHPIIDFVTKLFLIASQATTVTRVKAAFRIGQGMIADPIC